MLFRSPSFPGTDPGIYNVTVRRITGNTCVSAVTELTVNVQPLGPELVVNSPPAVCATIKADLTASAVTEGSTPGLTYTYWTDQHATVALDAPTEADSGIYFIKGTDLAGCSDIKPVQVTTNPVPVANAGPDITLQYVFQIRMSAEEPKFHEEGKWTIATGSAVFEDDSDPNTLITGLGLGENILLWSVSDGICPASEDFISVKVSDLEIPTLITPNGDSYNEYFLIRGIETLGITNLIIYDRRGVQVYKDDNYENDWNGLNKKGMKLPDDTYFYSLKSQNGKSVSGYVVIKR